MSETETCVVVGASHAGSQLAVHLRKSGWSGRIILIGAESEIPYHRPPLSKAVMAGEKTVKDIPLRPAVMYSNNKVELRLGARVSRILREEKSVRLETGETIAYDRLALCTGARPIRLPLGNGLQGVHYLRNIEDVDSIRADLAPGRRAVIIGAGYIGLEAAAVLAQLGLEVTVLERASRVLSRVTGEAVSSYITALHEQHGVSIHCHADVVSINGEAQADSVSCDDGSVHPADLVIVGVGIVPDTTLAEDAELRVENGIHVDEYGRSSDPDIFAAGDCASFPSIQYERRIRLESVQNANDQSRAVAANICGKQQVYDSLPWFWSDQYGIKLQSAGLMNGHDASVQLGTSDPRSESGFSLLYFQGDRLIAADCVNQARVFMACKKLIQAGAGRDAVLAELG